MKSLSISRSNLPDRPGYGSSGRSIILRTNYFRLLPKSDQKLFKYKVAITQKVKDTDGKEKEEAVTAAYKLRRAFTLLLQNTGSFQELGSGVATDYNAMIVTSKELDLGDDGRKAFPIVFFDKEGILPGHTLQAGAPRTRDYIVRIEANGYVAIPELLDYLDAHPASQSSNFEGKLKTLQSLNAIMAQTPNESSNLVTSSGNKFFPYPASYPNRRDREGRLLLENNLGAGLVALQGYYSSVRTSTLHVLLNVNVCTSGFYPAINLLDLFRLRMEAITKYLDYGKIEPFIKLLRVSIAHSKNAGVTVTQVKTIRGCSRPPRARGLHSNAEQIRFKAQGWQASQEDRDYRRGILPKKVQHMT